MLAFNNQYGVQQMPANLVKKLAKRKGISIEESEKLWDKANNLAEAHSKAENSSYVTGVFKKMMGENLSFKEFITLVEEGEPPTNSSGGTMPDHKATDGEPEKKKMSKRKKMDDDSEDDDSVDDDD